MCRRSKLKKIAFIAVAAICAVSVAAASPRGNDHSESKAAQKASRTVKPSEPSQAAVTQVFDPLIGFGGALLGMPEDEFVRTRPLSAKSDATLWGLTLAPVPGAGDGAIITALNPEGFAAYARLDDPKSPCSQNHPRLAVGDRIFAVHGYWDDNAAAVNIHTPADLERSYDMFLTRVERYSAEVWANYGYNVRLEVDLNPGICTYSFPGLPAHHFYAHTSVNDLGWLVSFRFESSLLSDIVVFADKNLSADCDTVFQSNANVLAGKYGQFDGPPLQVQEEEKQGPVPFSVTASVATKDFLDRTLKLSEVRSSGGPCVVVVQYHMKAKSQTSF